MNSEPTAVADSWFPSGTILLCCFWTCGIPFPPGCGSALPEALLFPDNLRDPQSSPSQEPSDQRGSMIRLTANCSEFNFCFSLQTSGPGPNSLRCLLLRSFPLPPVPEAELRVWDGPWDAHSDPWVWVCDSLAALLLWAVKSLDSMGCEGFSNLGDSGIP